MWGPIDEDFNLDIFRAFNKLTTQQTLLTPILTNILLAVYVSTPAPPAPAPPAPDWAQL